MKAGFARARSEDGWRAEPGGGQDGMLLIRKGNWTAFASLPGAGAGIPGEPADTALFAVVLSCDGARSKSRTGTASATPSPTTP